MSAFIETLRDEIDRLKAERLNLADRRTELVGTLDVRIAEIDERLRAAERMLTAYSRKNAEVGLLVKAGATPARGTDLTWADVEKVSIPPSLKGHRINPNSKNGKIIRAAMALLAVDGFAKRDDILNLLYKLGIMTDEKNPKGYLSVVLSRAREIFVTNGAEWRLRETNEAHPPADKSPTNSTTPEI